MKEINNLLERIRTEIDNEPLLKETDKLLFRSILLSCATEIMTEQFDEHMTSYNDLRNKIKNYKYEQTVDL